MPGRVRSSRRCLALLAASFSLLPQAFASALPPLILAAQSQNGQWLVSVDLELAPPTDSGGGRQILSTTYHVLSREPFLNNSRDRLEAPGSLWSERWSLKVPASDPAGLNTWPILSDDGATLLLFHVTAPFPDAAVLSIYREEQLRGRLVRTYSLANLWPPEKIDPKLMNFGYTPQWFAGGHFTFSPDNGNLLYRTRWGNTLVIRLADGAINPQPSHAR